MKDRKEYMKAYRQAHKEEIKEYYQAHKEERKAYYQAHKEESKEYRKAHRQESYAYQKSDVNSLGQTKNSIRTKSWRYLKKYGNIIKGYEIHHCYTYDEPYKFIYCSIEMHRTIHQYLRDNNISADSDHYKYIEHLLDDSVVKYGFN